MSRGQHDVTGGFEIIGAGNGACFFQLRVHVAEKTAQHHKHCGDQLRGRNKDHHRQRVDVERMLLETEQIFKPHVECAVIGVEQHDPAERVGQWRNRHVGKHGNLDNGLKRHVGSLDEPGQHSGQYESEENAASGVVSRIEKSLSVAGSP